MAGGGGESGIEWQAAKKCVRVSITRGMNCESRLFCLFSTAEKLGANSQPSPYSASKATIFFATWNTTFCHLAGQSDDVSALPQLRTYAYTSSLFFSVLIFVTTASTCCTASASLYGYILLFCCKTGFCNVCKGRQHSSTTLLQISTLWGSFTQPEAHTEINASFPSLPANWTATLES